MSTPVIRIGREAEEEFRAAITWYESQVENLEDEFWLAVRDTLEKLHDDPIPALPIPAIDPELRLRRLLVERFPYQIVFTHYEKQTRVIAIAHLKREPGYWKDRIA